MYQYKLEIIVMGSASFLNKYYTTVDYHKWYHWNALCTIISVKEIYIYWHEAQVPLISRKNSDELTQYYIAFSSFRKLLFFHKFATHDNTVCVMNWWKCAEASTSHAHTLDILFSSNRNIHKSSRGLCFWASDPLIDTFY